MKKCNRCKTVELSDFEEIKLGLCWSCISSDINIIEENPNIAEIKESELLEKNKFSVIIRDTNGTNFKMGAKKKDRSKKISIKDDSNEINNKPIPNEKDSKNINPQENDDLPPKEIEPNTTNPKNGKEKKIIEDEDELKVVRESKEILTKFDRAKTAAYSLINKALKETGNFELTVILNETKETVVSTPYKEGNIEDVLMTTSMEVLDPNIIKKKKK